MSLNDIQPDASLLERVREYLHQHYRPSDPHTPNLSQVHIRAAQADEQEDDQWHSIFSIFSRDEPEDSLAHLIDNVDEPFSVMLMKLIDAKGMTDVEVYKRANMDRKLFSKIRIGNTYIPRKANVLALAIGLKLTLPETTDFLKRAGYALSPASKFDVIIEFFIVNGIYDIDQINAVLLQYDQPLLGG